MENSPFSLAGKVALVTGSRQGLGAAMAVALARAGADVACHGLHADSGETCDRIRQLGRRTLYLAGDVSDEAFCPDLILRTIAHCGRLDILINNAGTIRRAPAADYSLADWDAVLSTNLRSIFQLSQLAARHMFERGSGKIINIASLLSFQGGILVPAYAAAKGGVAQLTKALANEWAARGINVNALAPGYMETANTAPLRADPVRNRQILERIPAGRWGRPEEVAGAAVFLSSAAADYVHGQVLAVDGGWLAR